MNNIKKVNKTDFIVIAIICLVAICIYIVMNYLNHSTGDLYGEIYLDGKLIKKVDLFKDSEFSIEEKPLVTFQVKDGKVAFIDSDCPDKVCIHTGFLGQNAQVAACLPNRLTLMVKSDSPSIDAPDIIVN